MLKPRKKTLFVVTEYQKRVRIETYWKDCFKDLDFNEFDVKILDGTIIRHDSFLFSDTHFKTTQLRVIMDLIHKNEIKRGDIFIFVNAWNFIAVPLSYFNNEFGMDFKIIGFWGNALFNQQSPMWQRFKKRYKKWGREFELSLFNSYDLNCFLCDEHLQLFRRKYPRIKLHQYAVTGFPFEYLTRNISLKSKEDLIIFPYEINDELQVSVFKSLRTDLPNFQFIFAQENHNGRLQYIQLMKKAKIMFCGRTIEYNPVVLWEGMLNGVFPAVPKQNMFYYFFPERYLYPPELVIPRNNKFLYLMRNRFQLQDFIKETFDIYWEGQDMTINDAKEITEKYYSNKPFLSKLKELC